ncbi:MAG: hypothetical protein EA398_16200 [Deltaproteobacteria bacterium]|nr:MAG: hypothetical protein EA398_16200 [Deltaproteobacteria bacterium]
MTDEARADQDLTPERMDLAMEWLEGLVLEIQAQVEGFAFDVDTSPTIDALAMAKAYRATARAVAAMKTHPLKHEDSRWSRHEAYAHPPKEDENG